MDHCPDHRDNCKKIIAANEAAAVLDSRVKRLETWVGSIADTIFGSGSDESLKSRIKGTEDEVHTIKDMVLDNRKIVGDRLDKTCEDVKEQIKEYNQGFTKQLKDFATGIYTTVGIIVSIACIVMAGMFTLVWSEVKSLRPAPASVDQDQTTHKPSSTHAPIHRRASSQILESGIRLNDKNYRFTFVRQYDNKSAR